jgi:hypothetical protein
MDANFQATANFEHLINLDMLSLFCILPLLEFINNKWLNFLKAMTFLFMILLV